MSQTQDASSSSATCWFCESNPALESRATHVDLVRIGDQDKKLHVPRCKTCANVHDKGMGFALGVVAGVVLALLVWWKISFWIALFVLALSTALGGLLEWLFVGRKLKGELADMTVKPIDVTIGEGRLKLSPHVLLDRTPILLVLDKGPAIEKVRFSPEQCKSWLKYVAPIMADATQVEGRFSVDLDGAKVPLPDPKTGDVAGTLKIHSAQVRSGPLVDQFVTLIRQIEGILRKRSAGSAANGPSTLLTMSEHDVPFRMVDGRVHHRGLAFSSGDVVIRTSGSVGFDETLSLVAEVPIPDKWVGSDRLLAGLKGHVLRIPIGGTLKRPQIDSRALAELARQLAGSAANRWIENELGKQMDKLFKPKQK